ncbi:MAG: uroporphyrinogen-III synthase [Halothiobacillus sp.]
MNTPAATPIRADLSAELPQVFVGRRIALPESRQLDVLAGLFERRGATVLRCPLVSIHDSPDQTTVRIWLDTFIHDAAITDLILLTGEGITRLVAAAERFHIKEEFLTRLKSVRLIVRGPKPGRALKVWDIHPAIQAETPTTQGIISTLRTLPNLGPRIGVVLYGTEPNLPLIEAMTELGAVPVTVAPYIYASDSETTVVSHLIEEMAAGRIDALAFTSQPQFKRLATVAEKTGQTDALISGMQKTRIAAIGPVMADYLRDQGVRVDVMPEGRFFMRPLVDALASSLADKPTQEPVQGPHQVR